MQYQDCTAPVQQADERNAASDADPRRLAEANISPATGLATDYLNHFNEAIMLLETLPSCPDCRDDLLAWRPMSYRQHFTASRFAGRDLAIAAYDAAEPGVRARLENLTSAMNGVLETARAALATDLPPATAADIACRAAAQLRPLAARAGAMIRGETGAASTCEPQTVVDDLMQT